MEGQVLLFHNNGQPFIQGDIREQNCHVQDRVWQGAKVEKDPSF